MKNKEFARQGETDRSRGDEGQGNLVESLEPVGVKPFKVVKQIETPRLPDPIMRRPCADREEKRVTHANETTNNQEFPTGTA